MKNTMKTRITAVIFTTVTAVTLSACGGGLEQSSLGAESPVEAAEIIIDAIAQDDWERVCAYTAPESATRVSTYWSNSDDTCADNALSVMHSEHWGPTYLLDQAQADSDYDWSSAIVEINEDVSPRKADVMLDYRNADNGEWREASIRSIETPLGWQVTNSMEY